MKILTAAEMKEVDRVSTERAGIPSLTLMENAGRGVAEFVHAQNRNLTGRRVVVLCGKGNNGGDGFVAARHLLRLGVDAEAILFASPADVSGDAAENLRKWHTLVGEVHVVTDEAAWENVLSSLGPGAIVVDALLGTGARGAAEGLLARVIHDVNGQRSKGVSVVAVDIPSGLIADTGEAPGEAIAADYTVTFTAPKIGMLQGTAAGHIGELIVCDIGSPAEIVEGAGHGELRWLDAREFAEFAARRKSGANKGDYGHALIVAGAVGKSGAAVLSSWAALRVGAGLVTVATAEPALPLVATHTPEVMTEPLAATEAGTISLRSLENGYFKKLLERKRALAIGPGLGTHQETQEFIRGAARAETDARIILDADGLNAFAGRAGELKQERAIAITPHPGEMARLAGCSVADIQKDRIPIARKAAADWNAFVILKGEHTVVAAPDGRVAINSTGNPGMATGGTGDVLTGMLAGLTAEYAEHDWFRTLCFGVYLHGLAGDVAYAEHFEAPLMASDVIRAIPGALQKFRDELGRE